MDFWVRSEDGDELLCPRRINIKKSGKGYAIGCYEENFGWMMLAEFQTRDDAKAQLDHMQCIMRRKSNEKYVYDMATEKASAGKSSE